MHRSQNGCLYFFLHRRRESSSIPFLFYSVLLCTKRTARRTLVRRRVCFTSFRPFCTIFFRFPLFHAQIAKQKTLYFSYIIEEGNQARFPFFFIPFCYARNEPLGVPIYTVGSVSLRFEGSIHARSAIHFLFMTNLVRPHCLSSPLSLMLLVPKAPRKKVVATANFRECVYKRTDEPSVPFYEKGGTAKRVTDFFCIKKCAYRSRRIKNANSDSRETNLNKKGYQNHHI